MNILVTGGAGFIGTHLTRRLLREGHAVSVLDNFTTQVHGGAEDLAADLSAHINLFRGDIRDRDLVFRAIDKQEVIVHLAAQTGTGQSMYEVLRYESTNIRGTATILDVLVNNKNRNLKKFIVASSRAIYGEGQYQCREHGTVYPESRTLDRLHAGLYELTCPICHLECVPEATSESCPVRPSSFYGLTKQVQEEMVLMFARTLGFSAYALRYQNVYGPGQSTSNPYTGILAIFSTLASSNSPIKIFEDGKETRDFVYIEDVVEATYRCISSESTSVETLNVGTGLKTSVLEVAQEIVKFAGSSSDVTITGAFRAGDIRHNFADLSKIQRTIGFKPSFTFREGLEQFLTWAARQQKSVAGYEESLDEMRERGLLRG